MVALELSRISKRFVAGAGNCLATASLLRSFDLAVNESESVAIVGGAASGKTTVLLCAAGLLMPDDGEVKWFGETDRAASRRVTYHFAGRGDAIRPAKQTGPRIQLIDGPECLRLDAIARLSRWIARHRRRGDAIVVATRDWSLAHHLCARVVQLRSGRADSSIPRYSERAARVAEPSAAAKIALTLRAHDGG